MRSNIARLILIWFLFSATLKPVFAEGMSIPSYPNCVNPQADPSVSYIGGNHGIVGSMQTYSGADNVYNISSTQVLQCFCGDSGDGIQTNWLKTTGISTQELSVLENSGWTLIPDGSAWGLDPIPYLARNLDYMCLGGKGGGTLGIHDSGNNSNNDSSNSNSSTSSNNSSSNIQSTTSLGQVLGLAFTGNTILIMTILISGFMLLVLGIVLRKNNR